jgi:protein O-mannosyl-transferase
MTPRRLPLLILPALVFALGGAPFLPSLQGQFLDWDDSVNFVANPHYRGLGWSQIKWMLSATLMGHYIPVTWMSFGLNYALGGMSPWGYHLGNVLLHATSTVLVYLIARRILAAAASAGSQDGRAAAAIAWASAFAALLWALHPLRVESVAWITERRDVLCGVFFLGAVLAYLKGVERGGAVRPAWWGLSLAASLAALLAKAAAMPLPAVLLLLDVYPLRRTKEGLGRVLLEKIPYAALSAATAMVALIVLPRGAAVTSYDQYGAAARIGMVAYSFVFYPAKFAWPMHLSPMYELPRRVDLGAWPFLAALLAFSVVSVVLVLARRRWPGGLAAWTYSTLMVLPISGVVHSGSQLANDRYSYLSSVGFALLGGGAVLSVRRLRGEGRMSGRTMAVFGAGAALLLVALALASWSQTQVWRDSETLWRWAVSMDPTCSLCQGNLGSAIANSDSGPERLDEAEGHLRRAIALRPDNAIPYFNLGGLLMTRKRYDEAEAAFRRYIELWPAPSNGIARIGVLHLLRGRYAEAIPLLEQARGISGRPAPGPDQAPATLLPEAIALVEDDPGTLILVGEALIEQGQPAAALTALTRAVALAPGSPRVHFWLVRAYREAGRPDLAAEELAVLRRLDPAAAERLSVR